MSDPSSATSPRGSSATDPGSPLRHEALAELSRPDVPLSLLARLRSMRSQGSSRSSGFLASRGSVSSSTTTVAIVVVVAVGLGAWVLLRRADGRVAALPHAGPVDVQRSTSTTWSDEPRGSSVPAAGTTVTVHVAGAVNKPGVVSLPSGSRAVDAVSAAGGLAPGADPDRLNLAAPLLDGTRVVVPLLGQPAVPEVAPPATTSGTSRVGGGGAPPSPLDLNTATAEQLDGLPGVGPATAAAIVSQRDRHGPFRSVDGLLDVRGIGDAKLEALRDLVEVAGS